MAITRVQATVSSSAAFNGGTLQIGFPAVPDASDGKFHYVMLGVVGGNGAAYITPTSDYGWTQIQNAGATTSVNTNLFIGRVFSTASTGNITINFGSAVAAVAIAAEYKSDNPLRIDRSMLAANGSSSSPSTGTTSTTTVSNELAIAVLGHKCQAAGPTQTSGTLTVGHSYKIITYVASDSFTNVGAISNAQGSTWVATGTTPSTWTNGTTVADLTGTFTSPTNSYTEIAIGGISTSNNTAGNDREIEFLEKFLSGLQTTSTGATVSAANTVQGIVATFSEVSTTTSQSSRIHGN